MSRRPTIQDLAAKANVSVSTIDRIISGRDKVRPDTTERVMRAAEEIGFYGLPTVRHRLQSTRPKIRLGFLLQQSGQSFYRSIAEALHQSTASSPDPVDVLVKHIEDLSPETVAEAIARLGEQVEALAVVSAEHPRVTDAIEKLAQKGISTYGLISELTATSGIGYVGLDNWRVGRTAGWAVAGMCKRPGRIGILVGNHRYRCQEHNESGFRSYCREYAPDFSVLEPIQTFENNSIARDVTEHLLRREPDLVGLYIAGGGMPGALEALRSSGRASSIVTVGNDMTDDTRLGLIDRVLTMVFAHPIQRLANEAIAQMVSDRLSGTSPGKRILGFELVGPENT